MSNFILFDESDKTIGLISRLTRSGAEYELVKKYISYLEFSSSKRLNTKIAIFVEPKIESGYPDIVIVEYNLNYLHSFTETELALEKTDLKILFECMKAFEPSVSYLCILLGFKEKDILKSVKRLVKFNLLMLDSNCRIFLNERELKNSIKKITAIEAKIDKWSEALEQAKRNYWFATESFILLSKETCNQRIIDECQKYGVGIILVNGKVVKLLKSQSRGYPISYGSLQFWNWIVRKESFISAIDRL